MADAKLNPCFITEKTLLFQGSRGGLTFSRGGGGGGGNFFQEEMHITCDFQGGSRPPIPPPLDPHMAMLGVTDICAQAMSTD